jgi:membrane-bound lytic murein transglycosylase D
MNLKKMMKKHLITCSVILVLTIIFAFSISSRKISKTANLAGNSAVVNHSISKYVINNNIDAVNDYSFANEALPLNSGVYHKMQKSLRKHNYSNVQSHILQIKATRLFPVIEPILRAYGIPEDFKYLPLVESGLKEGTSIRGAAGLWQFMPGTARTYGLRVGHGVDERKNVYKSTVAACKYIRELYAEFNSWTLTAAAYNNGSIKLAKAMRQQGQRNYFKMHLNRETGNYVYNLVAMKAIIDNPHKYGYGQAYYSYVQPKNFLFYN